MKDIFEVPEGDVDPFLDKIVMSVPLGCLAIVVDRYTEAIRQGATPEDAYFMVSSPESNYFFEQSSQ